MSILDDLEKKLKKLDNPIPYDNLILRGIWKMEMAFKPTFQDSGYVDRVVLVQARGSGFCTCYEDDPQINLEWVGHDIRELEILNRSLRIAILDAAFHNFVGNPTYSVVLKGSSDKKAVGRASIIAHEVGRLNNLSSSKTKVLVIGAVGNIIAELSKFGFEVYASDFDKSLIGKTVEGVLIENGLQTPLLLRKVDIALITGMAINTNTLDEILSICNEKKILTVMFAQTGANFASEYIEHGINTVVAESFPNYIFPGDTAVKVYRKA